MSIFILYSICATYCTLSLNELGYEGLRIKHNALGSQNGCRGAFLRSFEKFIVLWYNLFDK